MPDASGTISLAFDGKQILAEVWGAFRAPTVLGSESNKYHAMLLIQLSLYSLYQITHCHQVEFADQRLPLIDVDRELHRSLCHIFLTAGHPSDLFQRCDRILYRRMESRIVSEALLTEANAISDCHGQMGVAQLAKKVGYSAREPSHHFQVHFETEDLDAEYGEQKKISDWQWVHESREYPWGQRDIRIYDPNGHIVEIAEDMAVVIKRFLGQGLSIEAIAKRTMFPVEAVKQYAG